MPKVSFPKSKGRGVVFAVLLDDDDAARGGLDLAVHGDPVVVDGLHRVIYVRPLAAGPPQLQLAREACEGHIIPREQEIHEKPLSGAAHRVESR